MKAEIKIGNLMGASCCCLVVLLLIAAKPTEADSQPEDDSISRLKRQASSSRTSGDRQIPDGPSTVIAQASASSSGQALKPAARPGAVSTPLVAAPVTGDDRDEPERPNRNSNRPKAGRGRPPSRGAQEYDDFRQGRDEDADCEHEDGDRYEQGRDSYGRMFESMASNPMRHFRQMMNSVFDQIPNNFGSFGDNFAEDQDNEDDDDEYRGNRRRRLGNSVASSASASFNSGDGGYSKLASSVTSNGRTRGIISETRNGRTNTRRIGDQRDDVDE